MAVQGSPAILGGTPLRKEPWPPWPAGLPEAERPIEQIIRSRRWTRHSGHYVRDFEEAFARRLGVKFAVTVCGGTSALACMMHGVEVAPGDEVLVTPYTFHTGAAAPLFHYALPVFVDVDRESFQMDARKIEEKITADTRAILVCHWGGQAAEMDGILAIARKHQLMVCEDSYQALFGEWRGRQLGSLGNVGMLGHHQSELLPCGEGTTLISNDETVMQRCYVAHDFGRRINWDTHMPVPELYGSYGHNMKVTEVQGALLLAALEHVEVWAQQRVDNANYLKSLIREIPGITPQKEYAGQTRPSYSWVLFRYDPRHFNGLSADAFAKAMQADGILLSRGLHRPLSKEPYLETMLSSGRIRKIFSPKRLERMRESLHCPEAEQLCREAVGFPGWNLHVPRQDMEVVTEAMRRIQKNSAELRRKLEGEVGS